MDIKNHGKTWLYQKREKYAGLDINAKNHRVVRMMFEQDYLSDNISKVESGEVTEDQLIKEAKEYSAAHIRYNKKMKEAHDRGKTHFMFNGRVEPVRTVEMLERFKDSVYELQEKYSNLKQENEQGVEQTVE
jgi:hypothetical protein